MNEFEREPSQRDDFPLDDDSVFFENHPETLDELDFATNDLGQRVYRDGEGNSYADPSFYLEERREKEIRDQKRLEEIRRINKATQAKYPPVRHLDNY